MNLQSLVVVVLRLMALDFLLRAAVQLTPPMLIYFGLYQRSPIDSAPRFLPWLVLASVVVCAVLLWFLAVPIARLVTRGVSHDLSFGAMSLVDCYSIAFMAVGLIYISSGLPQVLNWTYYLFKAAATSTGDSWKQKVNWFEVSQAFIPFIVGMILFVKGRCWAVVLARRQTESESSTAPVSQHQEVDT
jgi:hypothetical protein